MPNRNYSQSYRNNGQSSYLSTIQEDSKGDKSGSYSNLSTGGRYSDSMSSSSRPYSSTPRTRSYATSINMVNITDSASTRDTDKTYYASRPPIGSAFTKHSTKTRDSYPGPTFSSRGVSPAYHPADKWCSHDPKRSLSHSTSSLSATTSSTAVLRRATYDSGIRSYNSARALNDSNNYSSRYGSSYEPASRYNSSAAASSRYGGSTSAVDRYSSPIRTIPNNLSGGSSTSYSNLRHGSGDNSQPTVTSTYHSPYRDYPSKSPTRSFSYASGLAGSGSGYSPSSNVMTRSTYMPTYRSSDYTSRFNAKRPDDYGGSSGRLYTSFADAHNNIAGRRASLARGESIQISSTPPTPTESVVPAWREHSVGAVPSGSKAWSDSLRVDTSYQPNFTLAKPPLPASATEKQSSDNSDKQKNQLTADDDFNTLYDRYVTHSPIAELERGPAAQRNGNDTAEQADDSAYSSRMEESGATKEGSETLSQTRTSDNEGDEIEYEAEEVVSEADEPTAQKDDNSETEKEDHRGSDDELNEEPKSSRKACLEIDQPWQQSASSCEDEEEDINEVKNNGQSVEPDQSMTTSIYEPSGWPKNNEEEEEEEEQDSSVPRRPKRAFISFADAIRKRCEEVTGVTVEEEKETSAWRNPMTSSTGWEQFSFYDDGEGDEAEGEEEATDEVPPWQQFIDYTEPSKLVNKYHIQVQPVNQSESEYTSDEDERHSSNQNRRSSIQGGKAQIYTRFLAPPKDSGAETSSEVESDYEAAAADGSRPRTFPFLPKEEKTEERGRVTDAQLAQPPPVFSIKVTYDDYEEESVGTVSDYEDFSDEEEEEESDEKEATEEPEDRQGSMTPTRQFTPALEVPQIMVTSIDMNDDYKHLGRQDTLKESSIEPDEDAELSYASHDEGSDHSAASIKPIAPTRNYIEIIMKRKDNDSPVPSDHEIKADSYVTEPTLRSEPRRAKSEETTLDKKAFEIKLEPMTASMVTENVASEWIDRYCPKKEDEAQALLRTVRGVSETAKTVKVEAKQAPAAKPKAKSEARELPPVQLPAAQFGVQQRQEMIGERVDPYSFKKPQESWARKSVVPDAKLDKVMSKSLTTKLAPEPAKTPEVKKHSESAFKKVVEADTKKTVQQETKAFEPAKQTMESDARKTAAQQKEEPAKGPFARRGSGIVEAMASKFKTEIPPPSDTKTPMVKKAQQQVQKASEPEKAALTPDRLTQRSVSPQASGIADTGKDTGKTTGSYKRTSSQPPTDAPTVPQGPTFEEQMEELRKKMKAGTSQLSQQMKDMSKGMVDATVSAKLAAEVAATRGLIDDAANLRQQVSKKFDQWKTTAQEEMEKRERELQQPLAIKKPPVLDTMSKSSISPMEGQRRPQEKTRASSEDASPKTETATPQEQKQQQQPHTRKTITREPGKISSPFADKVRRESELAKAAIEEQARKDVARREQQRQEHMKQQRLQEEKKHYEQQKLLQQTQQQLQNVLMQQTQEKAPREPSKGTFPAGRRPEPEGESDQHDTAAKRTWQRPQPQQPASTVPQKIAPAPAPQKQQDTTNRPVESAAKKEAPEFAKSKLNKPESVPQTATDQARMKSKQLPAESNKDKTQQLGNAAQIGAFEPKGHSDKPKQLLPGKEKPKAHKSRRWRRRRPNRFIGAVQDIDEILNSNNRNRLTSFDQFELFYQNCSRDTTAAQQNGKVAPPFKTAKVFISDIMDVDQLFAPSDLRAVMGQFSPTSKVAFNFDEATVKSKTETGNGERWKTKPNTADKCRKSGDGGPAGKGIDESTFQIYRSYEGGQGDYGTYLDSDISLAEQPDELAVLKDGKRTSLVLRTQLSVRVHTIIEKLLNSTGRELRRALFSLKQIFQDDKDLVHEFVQNDGLACLIKVGTEADQNYQNYILRAIGQVMLYVDGMNGCIAHNETIQWLYSLLASPYRLVVKTALKLLLVFVEYTESNSLLLLAAVYIVDKNRGAIPWSNLTQLLTNKDNAGGDLELLIYAMTLLNTTLNGIPDQDTYYDVVDALEEQGIEDAIKKLLHLGNKDLADQCRLYEAVLREEDGAPDENGTSASINGQAMNIAKMRQTPRTRTGSGDRKSQRKRIGGDQAPDSSRSAASPRNQQQCNGTTSKNRMEPVSTQQADPRQTPRVRAPPSMQKVQGQPQPAQSETPGLPANKRLTMDLLYKKTANSLQDDDGEAEPKQKPSLSSLIHQESIDNPERDVNANLQKTRCPPPALPDLSTLALSGAAAMVTSESPASPPPNGRPSKGSIGAVHSLAERFKTGADNQNEQPSPAQQPDDDDVAGGNPFANALARAKKGMDKKIASREPADNRKESEIQWEQAMQNWRERPLIINDLDFTELDDSDDQDPVRLAAQSSSPSYGGAVVNPYTGVASYGGGGPPPPPSFGGVPPPPPPGGGLGAPPPPRLTSSPTPSNRAPSPNVQAQQQQQNHKTVKLFWKEAQVQPLPGVLDKKGVFWEKVKPVDIDVEKLNQLFETKTKDVVAKKKEDTKSEIRILDTKRSNAINIGLKKLPPPGAIRTAITKFDSAILNKEGIEKILTTMMPTEEEKERIANAVAENPDVNLGEAEKFLVMLGEIPQLHARLRLWMFMLDYSNIEKEVADPLMDLKLAMQELDESKTFQYVMATLLAVGNYLNGAEIKGFQLDYLAKVPEVKDTVHKHSLVYHLCTIVMEKFPDATDLYSELGAVVRCARVDFDEIDQNLQRLEKDCRASWDYLRLIAKHEPPALKQKMSEFLTECAQRIMTLKTIHRRVINRFRKFLLYMGMPQHSVKETKVNSICKTISEFALEYRTCRDKMQLQKKRLMEKRERNKTRGKMITETRQLQQNGEVSSRDDDGRRQHDELSRVLRSSPRNDDEPNAWMASFPGARLRSTRHPAPNSSGNSTLDRSITGSMTGGQESPDDEILDGLVKAATVKTDPSRVEQRRKARQFNRKSLRRTRTLKLVEDQVGGGDDSAERNY